MTKCLFCYALGYLAHHLYHIQINNKGLIFAPIIAIIFLIAKGYKNLYSLLCIFLGYLTFYISILLFSYAPWPSNLVKSNVDLLIRISSLSKYSCIGEVKFAYAKGSNLKAVGNKVKVTYPYRLNPDFVVGDYVWVDGEIIDPERYMTPGSFNPDKSSWQNSINATVKLKSFYKTGYVIRSIREDLIYKISNRYFDSRAMPIVLALLLGTKELMQDNDKNIFAKTGTSHLVAISGLHIGLVYVLVVFLLSRFTSRLYSIIFGLLAATLYSFIAGFGYPCQRALIFISLIILLDITNRGHSRAQVIAIAFLIISFIQPSCIYDYGMWMSFAAIISIELYKGYVVKNKALKVLLFQYVLFVMFLPIGISGIGNASFVGVLSNIYAVPLFSIIIMPSIFIFFILFLLYLPAADILYGIISSLLEIFINIQERIYSLTHNFAIPEFYTDNPLIILIFSFILLFILIRGSTFNKAYLLLALFFIWRGCLGEKVSYGDYKAYVIDVGQGTSVLIKTKNHNLLYDTGTKKAGKMSVEPLLKVKNIKYLDRVVISHWDLDHSGGLDSIAKTRSIGALVASTKRHGVDNLCRSGEKWVWDGVNFEFLYPSSKDIEGIKKENNKSCVLRVSTDKSAFTLFGDVDKNVESKVIESITNKEDEVVLLAHHGSRTSTSRSLLYGLNPSYAFISHGRNNRYGHPHAEVVESLLLKNVRMLATGDCGTIAINLTKKRGGRVSATCYSHTLKRKPYFKG